SMSPSAEEDKSSPFEKFAVFFCWLFVVLFFPLSLCCCIIVVPEYIRLIILRLGRLRKGAKGPGMVFYLPCIDDVQAVDMRTDVYKVLPQEVVTKDSVTITVNAVIYYCIYDAIDSIIQVDNVNEATLMIAKVTLRNIVGSKTLNVLLTSRQALSREILLAVAEITGRWGVRMERVDIMDISLPDTLKRSLASEAEAVREARAKIILAEGEAKASMALKEASDVMSENQITLQLRHLQVLSSLAIKKRVNVIFPVPLEIMEPFFDEKELRKWHPGGDDKKGGSDPDLPSFFTPKVYIEDPDLPDNLIDADGSEPIYDPTPNQGRNQKDEEPDNSKSTSTWGLATYFRQKLSSEEPGPSPRKRSKKATGTQTKGSDDSEPYSLLPSAVPVRPSSPRSAPEVPPTAPAPTVPPRTHPTPPTLPPIPPAPTRPPIPPHPTLPPIPPHPTLPPIPPPPTPAPIPNPPPPPRTPESQNKSNYKPDDNYYF
ncbi:hypothetical protein KR200_002993, partial [Drosophila serrata]